MGELKNEFAQALSYSKSATSGKEPSNQQKLIMYALFKQINHGPCKGSAPSKLKMIERAKYDEWKKLGQLSADEAMKKYINLMNELSPNWRNTQPKL